VVGSKLVIYRDAKYYVCEDFGGQYWGYPTVTDYHEVTTVADRGLVAIAKATAGFSRVQFWDWYGAGESFYVWFGSGAVIARDGNLVYTGSANGIDITMESATRPVEVLGEWYTTEVDALISFVYPGADFGNHWLLGPGAWFFIDHGPLRLKVGVEAPGVITAGTAQWATPAELVAAYLVPIGAVDADQYKEEVGNGWWWKKVGRNLVMKVSDNKFYCGTLDASYVLSNVFIGDPWGADSILIWLATEFINLGLSLTPISDQAGRVLFPSPQDTYFYHFYGSPAMAVVVGDPGLSCLEGARVNPNGSFHDGVVLPDTALLYLEIFGESIESGVDSSGYGVDSSGGDYKSAYYGSTDQLVIKSEADELAIWKCDIPRLEPDTLYEELNVRAALGDLGFDPDLLVTTDDHYSGPTIPDARGGWWEKPLDATRIIVQHGPKFYEAQVDPSGGPADWEVTSGGFVQPLPHCDLLPILLELIDPGFNPDAAGNSGPIGPPNDWGEWTKVGTSFSLHWYVSDVTVSGVWTTGSPGSWGTCNVVFPTPRASPTRSPLPSTPEDTAAESAIASAVPPPGGDTTDDDASGSNTIGGSGVVSPTESPDDKGANVGAIVGGVVGGVAALGLAGGLAFFLLRRKAQPADDETLDEGAEKGSPPAGDGNAGAPESGPAPEEVAPSQE
jgi:hypothetical protein